MFFQAHTSILASTLAALLLAGCGDSLAETSASGTPLASASSSLKTETTVSTVNLESPYFDRYEDARADFRSISRTAISHFKDAKVEVIPVQQFGEEDLTIDTLHIPGQITTENLIIVSSGVHGAEAATGSTIQRLILNEMLLSQQPSIDISNTGILFIHTINPYGYRHWRRVSGNNVDLNRNFSDNPDTFRTKNEGYLKLSSLLNPQTPSKTGLLSDGKFLLTVLTQLAKSSVGALTQSIAQGQYEMQQGIFFGGKAPEQQVGSMRRLVVETAKAYKKVLIIDLHTGYGKKGFMHLMPNPPDTLAIAKRTQDIFASWPIEETGTGGDFYANDGDFSTYVSRVLEKEGKATTPMLFEFGTVNSQTTKGSITTLRRVIIENQTHWYGAVDEATKKEVHADFKELFFPSDPAWRSEVLSQIRDQFPRFVSQFQKLK